MVTFFDEVLVVKAVEDGGRYVSVGQQDSGQHGELVTLRLVEALEEQQQLWSGTHTRVFKMG